MLKLSLFPVTLLTLFGTGWLLSYAGWFTNKASAARVTEVRRTTQDVLASDAAWRYRTSQPTHWRALMLMHR